MIIFDINEYKNFLKEGYRILCFDVGQVRIGTALSDTSQILATPYLLINTKKQKFTLASLKSIIDKENIYGIVVGNPLQMDGERGSACLMVDKFINKYLIPLEQPIFLQDERMSSAAVSRYFKDMELSRKQQVDLNDTAAASYILQIALDKLSNLKRDN